MTPESSNEFPWISLWQLDKPHAIYCVDIRVLRGAGWPARVAGTCVCGAGAGTRTALRAGAGRVRVVLAAGAGRARVEKFFVRVIECWAKAPELNQLKNRKTRGCTAVELFASIALETVGLQQLLHYDITTIFAKH